MFDFGKSGARDRCAYGLLLLLNTCRVQSVGVGGRGNSWLVLWRFVIHTSSKVGACLSCMVAGLGLSLSQAKSGMTP
jgi:hypothetical protein